MTSRNTFFYESKAFRCRHSMYVEGARYKFQPSLSLKLRTESHFKNTTDRLIRLLFQGNKFSTLLRSHTHTHTRAHTQVHTNAWKDTSEKEIRFVSSTVCGHVSKHPKNLKYLLFPR